MSFYVDSCIYLNLWQIEESPAGKKLWKCALDFFEYAERENMVICFSGFVLKEIEFVLAEGEFEKRKKLFQNERLKKIIAAPENYEEARKLESASGFSISFFDCMHIVLANKSRSILITRDNKLIDFALAYCRVAKPEDITFG